MEIVVGNPERSLCVRERKDNLRHPSHMLLGFRMLLQEVVEGSLKEFHDRCNHRHVLEGRPGKGFLSTVVVQSLLLCLVLL